VEDKQQKVTKNKKQNISHLTNHRKQITHHNKWIMKEK